MRRILTTLAVSLLCFELFAWATGLPHLGRVAAGLQSLWATGTLQHDILVSLARWSIGCSIGFVSGVLVGLVTGRGNSIAGYAEGPLNLLRSIPFLALLPLSLRIFGISEIGKALVLAWAAFGITWFIIHRACLGLPEELVWRSQSLGLSGLSFYSKVVLPHIGSSVLSALKSAVTFGFIVVAVVELGGVYERSSGEWWSEGLGYRMFRSLEESRDDLLMASLLLFAATGASVENVVTFAWRLISRALLSWRITRSRDAVRRLEYLPSAPHALAFKSRALSVKNLSAGYGERTIIKDISIDIPPGETLCIIGRSGCGKSTLLKAVGGVADRTMWVTGGEDLSDQTKASRKIGFVFQSSLVFDHLLATENIAVVNPAAIVSILTEFDLMPQAYQLAGTLSGGQRQRLALAAALSMEPDLLLLDEPLGALDYLTRRSLQKFYWNHVRGRITTVFVTHSIDEALLLGDRVMVDMDTNAEVFQVPRNRSMSFNEWDSSSEFFQARQQLLRRLTGGENSSPPHPLTDGSFVR